MNEIDEKKKNTKIGMNKNKMKTEINKLVIFHIMMSLASSQHTTYTKIY